MALKPGKASPTSGPAATTAEGQKVNTPAAPDGVAGTGGDVVPAARHAWLEAANKDRARLEGAKKRLFGVKATGPAVAVATLGGVFPGRFRGLAAKGAAGTGTVPVGTNKVPVASRSYGAEAGAKVPGDIYLKWTDTGPAPELRAAVVAALTEVSEVGGYLTRGGFVRGYPAVLTYSSRHRAGKAAVLVGDRYLLEARIEPVGDPKEIARVLGELDWSRLAARDGAGR